MPTYDYVCTECGFSQEVFQSMKDNPLSECPSCHRSSYRRRIGAGAGLIFKGSGFYQTDYKKSTNGSSPSGKTQKPSSSAASTTDTTTPASDSAPTSTPSSPPPSAPSKDTE